jgi:hypothetical protein
MTTPAGEIGSRVCPQRKEIGDVHEIIYGMPDSGFDYEKYESGGGKGVNKPRSKVI